MAHDGSTDEMCRLGNTMHAGLPQPEQLIGVPGNHQLLVGSKHKNPHTGAVRRNDVGSGAVACVVESGSYRSSATD